MPFWLGLAAVAAGRLVWAQEAGRSVCKLLELLDPAYTGYPLAEDLSQRGLDGWAGTTFDKVGHGGVQSAFGFLEGSVGRLHK